MIFSKGFTDISMHQLTNFLFHMHLGIKYASIDALIIFMNPERPCESINTFPVSYASLRPNASIHALHWSTKLEKSF